MKQFFVSHLTSLSPFEVLVVFNISSSHANTNLPNRCFQHKQYLLSKCSSIAHALLHSIHEKVLRLAYNDRKSSFEELLRKDNTVHHRNLQVLVTEIFKIKNIMAPEIVNEIFQNMKSSYSLRKNPSFYVRQVH